MAKGYVKTYLDKSKLFAINDIKTEEVFIEEWGQTVFVRGLTAKELMDYVNMTYDVVNNKPKDLSRSAIILVGLAMCDEQGNRLLSDDEFSVLENKSSSAIAKLASVAQRLSGLDSGAKDNSKN